MLLISAIMSLNLSKLSSRYFTTLVLIYQILVVIHKKPACFGIGEELEYWNVGVIER